MTKKPSSVADAAALPSAEVASALGVTPGAGLDPEHGRRRACTARVVGQVVRADANRSIGVPVLRLPSNGFLLAAWVLAVGVQAAIPAVPALADAFRATPLDAGDWTLVLGVALAPSVVAHALRLTGCIAVA